MKQAELDRVLAVVLEAARAAGDLAAAGYRTKMPVEHKGVVDLVTHFDRESETLLRARIGAEVAIPIVGEEQGGVWSPGGLSFFIDPIDGTTNFVHGHPFWCVSVGLVDAGVPILGVVAAPALGIEWWGTNAEDAPRSATRFARGVAEEACVSTTTRFEDSLLATGFPYDRRTSPDNNFDAFVAIKQRCQAVRRCGSAALDLCLVADGTYEGYWEKKLNPWDIAAGTAIVAAAGGHTTDFDGGSTFIATGHVVATNQVIHEALLTELARVHSARPSRPV